jgi:hypothetical protein
MTSPSRDQLLGYLLEALGPDEQEQVEAELNVNEELRTEMGRLAARIGPLGLRDEPGYFDPPAGLAERTCQYVAAHLDRTVVMPSRAVDHSAERRRLRWSDFVAAGAILVAAASLFFPALSFSRFQSQVAACQNQLRLVGHALHEYSDLQADHSFPGPEAEGPRSAAGIVAPLLVGRQLADSHAFLCPASSVLRDVRNFRVPRPEELDQATELDLRAMQRMMGGDFGYNMGYEVGGQLLRACNTRRSTYALAGDAPSNSQPKRVSANHGGRGQNILYEDGRVQFLRSLPTELSDDPYHNREGWVAPGVDRDDAVLGASADRPLPMGRVGLD